VVRNPGRGGDAVGDEGDGGTGVDEEVVGAGAADGALDEKKVGYDAAGHGDLAGVEFLTVEVEGGGRGMAERQRQGGEDGGEENTGEAHATRGQTTAGGESFPDDWRTPHLRGDERERTCRRGRGARSGTA
jgi:hypothetical protein